MYWVDIQVSTPLPVQGVAALLHVHRLHGVPDHDLPSVRLLVAEDHLEQGALPRSVAATYADHRARRDVEREVIDQQAVSIPFVQSLDLQRPSQQRYADDSASITLTEVA